VPWRDLTDPPLLSQGIRDTLNLYLVCKYEVKAAKNDFDTIVDYTRTGKNSLDTGVRASCHQH